MFAQGKDVKTTMIVFCDVLSPKAFVRPEHCTRTC